MTEVEPHQQMMLMAAAFATGGVYFDGTILGPTCFAMSFSMLAKAANTLSLLFFKCSTDGSGRPFGRMWTACVACTAAMNTGIAAYTATIAYKMATPTLPDALAVGAAFFFASGAALDSLMSVMVAASIPSEKSD